MTATTSAPFIVSPLKARDTGGIVGVHGMHTMKTTR